MKKESSNLKSFSFLTAFSLSEKVIAFVYQAIIAAILGAGAVTDCYFSASQFFDLIDSTVLGALVVVVINRYANICEEKDEAAGIKFLSRLNSLLSLIMLALAVLTFIFAKPFSYVIAPGFEEEVRPELVKCIRILCVIPPVMVFSTIAQGLLRQKKRFIIVNSRSLFISLCGMAVVLLFSVRDPENSAVLCWGYVAANVLFTLLLIIRSRHFGKIGYSKPVMDGDTKKLFVMAGPAIISKGVVRVSLMIDQIVSSMLGKGSISHLNYAQSLYNIVNSLLIINLCVIMFTDFTNLCVKKQYSEMVAKLRSAISSITLILAPVSLITVCFSREIVSIVYERGAFGADSTKAVQILLLFYAVGFMPAMLNSMHTQVLHAFGAMKTAMYITVVSFALNIVLNIALSMLIGIGGIALATTVSALVAAFFYKKAVRKYLPEYKKIVDMKFILKLSAGLLGCGAVILAVKLFIRSALISFAVASVGGLAVFAAVLILLKEEQITGYLNKLKKR